MPGTARLRAFLVAAVAAAFILTLTPSIPTGSVVDAASPAQRVIAIAESKVGAPYVWGTQGPSTFDCSGLVIWAFRKAGYAGRVGDGRYRSAAAMYRWFRDHGLASRTNPQLGDVVVWGGGTHVGIYVGNGKAVSALTQGVRVHGVRAVVAPFTAYLHTRMSGVLPASPVAKPAKATRVTTAWLNLRVGPSTARRVLTVLAPRTPLIVHGSRRDARGRVWLHVTVGSRTGWVARRYTRVR